VVNLSCTKLSIKRLQAANFSIVTIGFRGASLRLKWRLPSKEDFSQAKANGIVSVLPNMEGNSFWSATREDYEDSSDGHEGSSAPARKIFRAILFSGSQERGYDGSDQSAELSSVASVGCVGGP
jgi:hypothetical protein